MTLAIKRMLIANRGEIAVRIIRACRELGIETVQVHSEADRDSLPVRLADKAVCIGRARSGETYLNGEFIVSAAITQKADAIHPGYGFLSENAAFARLCELEDLVFVGPRADVVESMGNKAMARRLAAEAGVPIIPGSPGKVQDIAEAKTIAEQVGYPVILKASAGGGGRGMRVVWNASELDVVFATASQEAKAAFGDGAIYVERYLQEVRHVEVQVMGDGEAALHFGERDCSVQRRNQKLAEESPSPALTQKQRDEIGSAAVRLCRHVGYTNAGTVEFVLDIRTGEFYFIEMNTRIQVEHPVTEMVASVDLVKLQIRIAAGEPLQLRQDQIRRSGHAIECRINAEDPENNFAPAPGRIERYLPAGGPGVRVDSHLFSGYQVPPYYDSLLAKIITWDATREDALARMRRALDETVIEGVKTTLPFHRALLRHPQFVNGRVHTRFVEQVFTGAL